MMPPKEITDMVEEKYNEWVKDENSFPSRTKIAVYLRIGLQVLEDWEKQNDILKQTLKKIDALQLARLEEYSIKRKYDTTSAIFQMKVNHGKKETSVNEFSGKDGQPLIIIKDGNKSK